MISFIMGKKPPKPTWRYVKKLLPLIPDDWLYHAWQHKSVIKSLKTSEKVDFCLVSSQNIFQKLLGIIKMSFGKCEMRLWVLFG